MARLGSVVGGVLKELAQARAIADRHSRELVGEYERDPVLSAFSVPRVTLGEVNLTLRFTINDLEEESPAAPDYARLAADWQRLANGVLVKKTVARLGIPAELAGKAVNGLRSRPAVSDDLTAAIAAPGRRAAQLSAEELLEGWAALPGELRQALGNKQEFRRELLATAEAELASFLADQARLTDLRSALASKIDVGIRTADLPSEPQHIHEMTLTVRGEDIDMVLASSEEK
ncbi:MAG: hypothetical protein AB1450_05860 [Pseudomonadota bacterium]